MAETTHPFTVQSAAAAARAGRLEEWLQEYLTSGEWANWALADGLKLQKRWWRGPLKLPLEALARALGPEEGMEYQVDPEYWRWRTEAMADGFGGLESIPPLIVNYDEGVLGVRDGNHRLGAMERLGWRECWVVIWYNSEEDYLRHTLEVR